MPGGKRNPAGPFALVAVGLFVMTWASIRLWGPAPPARETEIPLTPEVASKTDLPLAAVTDRPTIAVATNCTPEPATSAEPSVEIRPAARVLDELASLPMVAELAPPVATRIAVDPVLTIEPELRMALHPALTTSPTQRLMAMDVRRAPSDVGEVRIAKAVVDHAPRLDRVWPYPIALVTPLKILAESATTGPWARDVLAAIDDLFAAERLACDDALAALDRLERLSDASASLIERCTSVEEQARLARVSFGLERRRLVWRQVERLAEAEWTISAEDVEPLARHLDAVERHFAVEPSWIRYLLVPELRAALDGSPETQGALARRVLARVESPTLTRAQRQLLGAPVVTELTVALQGWGGEPIDLPALLDALEELELGDNPQAGRSVAQAWQRLRQSADPEARQLAEHLNTYYRNANVRIAVSADLLNLLLPHQPATLEPVRDEILGARVFGRSQTSSRLRVVLLPDMRRLRLGLEAIGEVESDTAATKGPATLYSQGTSRFHARKMLSIDRDGLRVWRSQAEVDTHNQLVDVATDFDGLPFVGLLARAVARQEHDDNYYLAAREVRGKVAARAESKFDHEVHRQLAQAEQEFVSKIYDPLVRLRLEPTAVDLQTTREHLIARYRVAGQEQVAAYTPRPAASADSVLNVQIHQSTLNNVLEQLRLDGRRVELSELTRELAATFNRPLDPRTLEELPENVTLQFADHGAVRVYCDDDQLLLVIKLAELSQGRDRKWKNFTVQAYYAPSYDSLSASLVREGTIELMGERLNFRDQLALRGIFTKLLSRERTFDLVSETLARDPRLQSLAIEHFAIEDGWIGLSIAQPQLDRGRVAGENRARQ
jgi:hypothetical protein